MSSLQHGTTFSTTPKYQPIGKNVQMNQTMLHLLLTDGRQLDIPFTHFSFLAQATPEQRQEWEFTYDKQGIYWPQLDEYLSIAHLLGLPHD